MAKKIFSSQEDIQSFIENAQKQLSEATASLSRKKFAGSNDRELTFKFKMEDTKDDRKAVLVFSMKAWIKMRALVDTYGGEVQWHGVVERRNQNTFFVKDVLIFPHETTAATVVSNQEQYEKWLNDLDDETFNACRLHGHSHVNMGVTPSSVDMTYRHNVLDNFGSPTPDTDLFYIFVITNKSGDISGEIYDLQNNALYGTDEIIFKTSTGDSWLDDFIKQAKECVKETPKYYTYQPYKPPQSAYGSSALGYGSKVVTPPIPSAAQSAQSEKSATQTSILDDDYDDPVSEYEDWHRRIYGGHQ